MERSRRTVFSNTLLVMGVLLLGGFLAFALQGATIHPLVPAFAALCISGTAVLDRMESRELE